MRKLLLSFACLTLMSAPVYAKSSKANGDEFRKTAHEYSSLAKAAKAQGDNTKAELYNKLSAIKAHAANLADQGRWNEINWDEYHMLNKRLSKGK